MTLDLARPVATPWLGTDAHGTGLAENADRIVRNTDLEKVLGP